MKRWWRLVLAAALLVAVLCGAGAFVLWKMISPLPAYDIQAEIDRWSASHGGAGIVVGVIDRGKQSIFVAGSSGRRRPLDEHSLFEIGSITKTFTATLLAENVLAGRMRLSDPIQRYLPSSIRMPTYHGMAITLEDLATQTSGLPRMPSNFETHAADPYARYGGAQLAAFLDGYELERAPGAAYEYSNLAVGLLGYALVQDAHTSYEQLVLQRIAEPLYMHETFVDVPGALSDDTVVGHDGDGNVAPAWHFRALAGAGGLRSSLSDMLLYLAANMDPTSLGGACAFAQTPRRPTPSAQIGLIWMFWTNWMTWHNGETAGFHSFVGFTPDRRRGIVVLASRTDAPAETIGERYLSPF